MYVLKIFGFSKDRISNSESTNNNALNYRAYNQTKLFTCKCFFCRLTSLNAQSQQHLSDRTECPLWYLGFPMRNAYIYY